MGLFVCSTLKLSGWKWDRANTFSCSMHSRLQSLVWGKNGNTSDTEIKSFIVGLFKAVIKIHYRVHYCFNYSYAQNYANQINQLYLEDVRGKNKSCKQFLLFSVMLKLLLLFQLQRPSQDHSSQSAACKCPMGNAMVLMEGSFSSSSLLGDSC